MMGLGGLRQPPWVSRPFSRHAVLDRMNHRCSRLEFRLPAFLVAWLAATGTLVFAESLEIPKELREIYAGGTPRTLEQLQRMEQHQQKLAELVTECTVGIRVNASQGSGVLISKDGYILTAAHVAIRANLPCLVILPDGRQLRGVTLGLNRGRDAGLVKIVTRETEPDRSSTRNSHDQDGGGEAEGENGAEDEPSAEEPPAGETPRPRGRELLPEPDFTHLELAPADQVTQGMWCVATGHPGGYQRQRKPVVRLGRVLFVSPTLLRTDCVLVGGDSGGPLCDMSGRVIGIHSRIGGPITMNLHIPIGVFHDSWDRLVKGEVWGKLPGSRPDVAGAVLGVRGDPDSNQARIASVQPGLPAEKAGIRPGDIILKFDGKAVPDFSSLVELVRARKPGDKVLIELRRKDELIQVKVTLAERKPP